MDQVWRRLDDEAAIFRFGGPEAAKQDMALEYDPFFVGAAPDWTILATGSGENVRVIPSKYFIIVRLRFIE
jgi:hypothetical protein